MADQKKKTRRGGPKINTKWHEAFLERLRESGVVSDAAKAVGIHRCVAYDHRERFPKFSKAWDEALEVAVEQLEVEAVRRARDYSDLLLIFLLKAAKPHKYRETRRLEVSGPTGGPVEIATPQERRERMAALLDKVNERGDDSDDD
jgi:hypothetical protein